MRVDESALEELASAVADGAPVDWIAAEAGATTPAIRAEVRKLARLARISEYHAHSPDTRAGEDLHDSIRHEAGLNDAAESDARLVRWGPLTILDKIGQGSFGDVYRARDDRVGRDVALKLLRRKDSDAASHVIDEARLMAQVRHPNITAVFGADRIDGRVGLWMEFIDGPTLEGELKSRGPFGEEDVRVAVIQLAAALRAVHQAGLLHGDVKAQNVMRAPDGRLLLTDFGTGRPVEATNVVDIPAVAGSPLYLAPELFTGSPPSIAADLYSLGVLGYHLATGSFPVQGRTLQELSHAHASGRGTPLKDAAPGLSPQLTLVIDRLIDPDPARRFQDADSLLGELSPVASRRSWHGPAWVALAAVVVSVMAITGWLWRGSFGSPVTSSTTVATPPIPGPHPVAADGVAAATPVSTGAPSKPAPDDLPSVTSASNRARELYAEAAAILNGPRPWNNGAAEQILDAALKEDPAFASAHILMAWTIANRAPIWKLPWSPPTRDTALVRMLDHADKALRLAASASTVEQYFIGGSVHEMRAMAATTPEIRVEEYERARRAYEGLLRIAPNHRWVRHNLGNTYAGLNLWVEKGEFAVAVSDARPDEFGPAWTAAQFLLRRDDPGRAAAYAKRASGAANRDRSQAWPEAMLRMFSAHSAWVRSDVAAALAETDRAGAELASIGDERLRSNQTLMVTRMYITLGRLDAAGRISSETDHRERALILSQRGDQTALADFLRARYRLPGSRRGPVIQLLHAPAGLLDEARSSLSDMDTTWMSAVRGQLALAEGQPSEAGAHFERAIALDTGQGLSTRYADTLAAVDGLAFAWRAQGNVSKAISVLEERLGRRGETVLNASSGYAWTSARAHLAELYRRSDRERDARAVEAQLMKLLSVADETHPLLLSLKARVSSPR